MLSHGIKVKKLINITSKRIWPLLAILIIIFYSLIFYYILTYKIHLDFSSLYYAGQNLSQGINPYSNLFTKHLSQLKALPVNLNPPFAILIFSPLSHLSFINAITLWSIISFILGLIGAYISFNYAFSKSFIKKNWPYLYILYLSFFATIIDTTIAQLGALVLFLIMSGYHFYKKDRDYAAGLIWGIIIAIKLFPALLFIYALIKKRYKICACIIIVFFLSWLIPFLIYSNEIFIEYFTTLSKVHWYGASWNGGVYGLIFRLFVDGHYNANDLLTAKIIFFIVFFITMIFYLYKLKIIEKENIEHKSFCFTLVMMLILSPFGWLYYFPILILPLSLILLTIINNETKSLVTILLCFVCLDFINFPIDYTSIDKMGSLTSKFTIHSFYFYGLLILLYLVNKMKTVGQYSYRCKDVPERLQSNYVIVLACIFSFNIFVFTLGMINKFLNSWWLY